MANDKYCPLVNLHGSSPNAMRMNRLVRMSRRDVLLTGMGAAATCGLAGAAPMVQTATDPDVAVFMEVSHCLTDRLQLDPRIGAALYAGIVASGPERKAQIGKLHDIMQGGHITSSTQLAKAAEQADPALKDVIHDVMTGWYRGVANGKVVVYRSALMFDITKDAIYPKTYAAGGPFYWTSEPPDVARPEGQPALSPSKFVVEPT